MTSVKDSNGLTAAELARRSGQEYVAMQIERGGRIGQWTNPWGGKDPIIKEGWLHEICSQGCFRTRSIRRYVVLHGDSLYCFDDSG